MSIQDELNQIKNAVYGADVRDAIHDSIKKTYDDASANGNANMEVEMARGTEPTLKDRLDKMDDKDEILTARIDSFTTLTEGSTTGDAELIDMRIGADSIEYPNSGQAVRSQVTQLRDATNITKVAYQNNYQIRVGNVIGNVVDTTPTYVTGWSCAELECVEGTPFILSGYGAGNTPVYAFLDNENRLLEYSDTTTLLNAKITAPSSAAKIVINSLTPSLSSGKNEYRDDRLIKNKFSKIDENLSKSDFLLGIKKINFKSGYSIKIGLQIGYKIDLKLNPDPLWSCAVIECREGTPFILSGYGTGNNKFYAFIDANNRIIEFAEKSTFLNERIVAPKDTAKVVINSLTSNLASGLNEYSITTANLDFETINPKNLLDDLTSDLQMSAYVNGLKFADELQSPIGEFTKPGDLFAHVPTHKIINNMVYMTYYANTRTAGEYPNQMTARFVYAPLNDLSNKTYIDLHDIGDVYEGKTVTAIYDTILMTIDNQTLYLMWTAELDGEYYRLYRTFDVTTQELSGVFKNRFSVNGTSADLNVANMKSLMDSAGIKYPRMFSDIGIMQKLSSRIENGITYYYSGCYNVYFNCIVKSKDLITWEYVAQPDFRGYPIFENAVYVIGDICYYFLRQMPEYTFGVLTSYNLITGRWSTPVHVSDCQSRSDFIEHNGNLYLVHAPIDRYHISIMEINKTNLARSKDVQVASVPFYFYPYMDKYNGELYMSFADSYKRIQLSKFTIDSIGKDIIDTRMKLLFEI